MELYAGTLCEYLLVNTKLFLIRNLEFWCARGKCEHGYAHVDVCISFVGCNVTDKSSL